MAREVVIVDSGGANIASLQFAFERLGVRSWLSRDPAMIRSADRVLLPGVGAAADAMTRLREAGLAELLPQLSQPVLGICLGMQLLAHYSDEQATTCLGVLPATAQRLSQGRGLRVPNMGWCPLSLCSEHPLLAGIGDGSYAYFVHSYALPVDADTIATATHGNPFAAVSARGNFMAAQFHPERSAAAGARLLKNFVEMPSCS